MASQNTARVEELEQKLRAAEDTIAKLTGQVQGLEGRIAQGRTDVAAWSKFVQNSTDPELYKAMVDASIQFNRVRSYTTVVYALCFPINLNNFTLKMSYYR